MSQAVATQGLARRDPLEFRAIAEPGAGLRLLLRTIDTEGGTQALERLAIVPDQAVLLDAQELLQQVDAACMSGSLVRDNSDVVRLWLIGLNAGQVKPLDPLSLDRTMLPALLLACGDLPARCFCRDTLAEALRTIRFIGVAAIDGVVRPIGEELFVRRAALRAVVEAGKPRPSRTARSSAPVEDLTSEQRDAILARFRRQMAEAGLSDEPGATTVRHAELAPLAMDIDAKISRAQARLEAARVGNRPMVGYFEAVLADLEQRREGGEA